MLVFIYSYALRSVRVAFPCGRSRFLSSVYPRDFGNSACQRGWNWNTNGLLSREDAWLTIGKFKVYPWSVSGVETCVVVKVGGDLSVCFDVGYSMRESVKCQHVFISHGHMDHASGIHQHATKRQLYSWKPAKYYVPHHLNGPLKCIGHQLHKMAGTPEELKNLDIIPVEVGDAITLSNGYLMKPFPTHHRVPSQGYLLYKQFQNKSSQGMASLENVGAGLLQSENIPEVAYTGDTTFDAFLDPLNPDLLKVKLLIMEATYLENNIRTSVEKARERGHTHLFEIIQHEHLFRAVKSIVLIHFSDRYTSKTVRKIIHKNLPQSLQEKVHLATMALETR